MVEMILEYILRAGIRIFRKFNFHVITTLIILSLPASSVAREIDVLPVCSLGKQYLIVHVVITSKYRHLPEKHRTLWNIRCSLEDKKCRTSFLRLDELEDKGRIDIGQLDSRLKMRITSVSDGVAVLKLGTHTTFKIDTTAHKIYYQFKTVKEEAHGEGKCPNEIRYRIHGK